MLAYGRNNAGRGSPKMCLKVWNIPIPITGDVLSFGRPTDYIWCSPDRIRRNLFPGSVRIPKAVSDQLLDVGWGEEEGSIHVAEERSLRDSRGP